MFSYRICGLQVSSELELPGAILNLSPVESAAVTISRTPVPTSLSEATAAGPTWELSSDSFLLRIPRLARFLITAGREIAFELEPDATEHDATGFVLGTAFGVLLHQRGALVLHGSAVAKDGRAIAICGVSGAGKSTLAAALCRDGCSFATDDLCVIGMDDDRRPVVLPDGRRLKLWKESIDKLDLASRRGEIVRESFEKYYIEPMDTAVEPPRLTAIYVLRETRRPLKEGFESLTLPDAVRALEREAYRPKLRIMMGQKPNLLKDAAAVLAHAKLYYLNRERGFDHLPRTVAALREHWNSHV
jgi:hypothetical protein